jgi:hypothetical protein
MVTPAGRATLRKRRPIHWFLAPSCTSSKSELLRLTLPLALSSSASSVLPLTRTLSVLGVWARATGAVAPSSRAASAVRAMLQAVVGNAVFISGTEGGERSHKPKLLNSRLDYLLIIPLLRFDAVGNPGGLIRSAARDICG